MRTSIFLATLGFHGFVCAAALTVTDVDSRVKRASSNKICIDLDVKVPVKTKQWLYDQPRVDNDIDAIDWTVNITTWSSKPFKDRKTELITVDRTFRINARLCAPKSGGKKKDILQIAVPGQAFDKRYFDSEVQPEQYSYVDAVIKAGYSILSFDRLGTGASEKPDAYKFVQVPTDIEILAGITKLARAGKLVSSSKIISGAGNEKKLANYVPKKVVHVGHAYGSYLLQLMWQKYGSLSDGALLTGYYINTIMETMMLNVLNYNHAYPKQNDPKRFKEYGSGYIVLDNTLTMQKLFFQKARLDPALLKYSEKIKQPESIAQYASETTTEAGPVPGFKGPIMFFTGELDNFVCNGDCRGVYDKAGTEALFPKAIDPKPYLQPGTGHASGLSKNATAGYKVMLKYLDSHGL